MKFKYIRTSEILSGDVKEIEINTLEELIKFQKNSGSSIVVTIDEDNYASKNYDNPLDACYELILKLNELKLL